MNRSFAPIPRGAPRELSSISKHQRPRIGVIAGSGPEAGIDLWSKILTANRVALGERFCGDVDSPYVAVFSEPILGFSMDLPRNVDMVWEALQKAVKDIVPHVDVFTIACNTLHYYSPKIREIAGDAVFLDVADVVRAYMQRHPAVSVALMGASSVAALDEWSPYTGLHNEVGFETPADLSGLHELIHAIKMAGGDNVDIRARFTEIVAGLNAPTIFLACTELPLVRSRVTSKTLVDINMLLAEELVRYSLGDMEHGRPSAAASES